MSNVYVVNGYADWEKKLDESSSKLVVVDFTATWCGPCQFIKPFFNQLSNTYTDVLFLSVDEGVNSDIIREQGVSGFPTFHFYSQKKKIDQLVGADQQQLRNKIDFWIQNLFNPFSGSGRSLGSGQGNVKEDLRTARLERFGHNAKPKAGSCQGDSCTIPSPNVPQQILSSDEEKYLLSQLMDMGFPESRSRKSIQAIGSVDLEACVSWLTEHEEEQIETLDNDKNVVVVEEEKSSTSEESIEEKKKKLKELIVQRRNEREKEEEVHSRQDEIRRREAGKQLSSQRDDIEAMQRKMEYERRRKEKEETIKERERLRAELAKDKAERLARGGTLTGMGTSQSESTKSPDKLKVNLEKLKMAKHGEEGLTAMKTLLVYITNILEKPEEAKFRSINLDNPAFKKRVLSCPGGIGVLSSLGFQHQKNCDLNLNLLVLDLERKDEQRLRLGQTLLNEAIQQW